MAKIILKRCSTSGKVPNINELESGELAVNTSDGKVFTKKDDGITIEIVEVGQKSQLEKIGQTEKGWRLLGENPNLPVAPKSEPTVLF